jgi:hypothetical protein
MDADFVSAGVGNSLKVCDSHQEQKTQSEHSSIRGMVFCHLLSLYTKLLGQQRLHVSNL